MKKNKISTIQDFNNQWLEIVNIIGVNRPSLQAILEKCTPKSIEDGVLTISTDERGFNYELIQKNRQLIEGTAAGVTGIHYTIFFYTF